MNGRQLTGLSCATSLHFHSDLRFSSLGGGGRGLGTVTLTVVASIIIIVVAIVILRGGCGSGTEPLLPE